MTNYERGIEKLNKELEELKAYQLERETISNEMSVRNSEKVRGFFSNLEGTLNLRSYDNDSWRNEPGITQWRLTFNLNPDERYNEFEMKLNVAKDGGSTITEVSHSSNREKDITRFLDWSQRVAQTVSSIQMNNHEIAELFNGLESPGAWNTDLRNEWQINDDIKQLEEMKRQADIGFRVGGTYMYDLNGNYARARSNNWSKITVTKINDKSIKFVVHYEHEDASKNSVSAEQAVRFDWAHLRTLENHEVLRQAAIQKEFERRQKWDKDVKIEDIRVWNF